VHKAVARKVAAHPFAIVAAEAGARDDPEAVLRKPRDGQVRLDAATPVQHLRVGDAPDVARHLVRAQALEQGGGPGPGDLELGERALVEERDGLTTGPVLGADGGRPMAARPAARTQRFVAGGGVALIPVDPLPA
jgi:hypothetical protein